jgi:hypothetical protein
MTQPAVRVPTWVFATATEQIHIQRPTTGELQIHSNMKSSRVFKFADIQELTAFQLGFEEFLLANGWTLVDFGPERRAGRDRRRVGRRRQDRRILPWPKRRDQS